MLIKNCDNLSENLKQNIDKLQTKRERMEYVYHDKLWNIVDALNDINAKDPKMVLKMY